MSLLRRLEAVGGVLSGLVGGAVIVRLLTGASYNGESCRIAAPRESPTCVISTATFVHVNGTTAMAIVSIIAPLLLAVAIMAVWHSRTSRSTARTILWFSTLELTLAAVLLLPNIGILLLPSVVLALVACLSSIGHRPAAA